MSEEFVDQEKTCRDCSEKFVFTAGENRFFAEKGFNPPTRCKPCRDKRKTQNAQGGTGPQQAPRNGAPNGGYRPQGRPQAQGPIMEYVSRPKLVVEPQAPSKEDREQRQNRRAKNRRNQDDFGDEGWG